MPFPVGRGGLGCQRDMIEVGLGQGWRRRGGAGGGLGAQPGVCFAEQCECDGLVVIQAE